MKVQRGFTLLELVVTLLILSILAAMAIPYAEVTIIRDKELDLRRSLREIRTAIDHFHEDWKKGDISNLIDAASADGYPRTLKALVDGTPLANGGQRKYLRRIPVDPFADQSLRPDKQWVITGYQDAPDSIIWNGQDVYDVHSASDLKALNGSRYKDW